MHTIEKIDHVCARLPFRYDNYVDSLMTICDCGTARVDGYFRLRFHSVDVVLFYELFLLLC